MENPKKTTKKTPKKSLGRGIGALLSQDSIKEATRFQDNTHVISQKAIHEKGKEILEISLDTIAPNPFQPRIHFDQEKLKELASSIKDFGIIEPLLVTHNEKEHNFFIVAGERRFRAAQILKKKTVPAIVLSLDDEQKMELAIIENIQREDLNPIELALSFKNIMAISKLTQEELAKKLSISRPVVSNLVRLLSLPTVIQEAIKTSQISQSHARLLLSLETPQQLEYFKKIMKEDMSVKDLEYNIQVKKTQKKPPHTKLQKESLSAYEQQLIEFFGTKVSLLGDIKKGTISISYYNQEDFSRILDLLNISFD